VEEALWASGCTIVAGVDEVGKGPLAGPVYAAAVVLDRCHNPGWVSELRDSKVLLAPERERLAEAIRSEAPAWGIGYATVAEINFSGITKANYTAMLRALSRLRVKPAHVLIDGPLVVPGNPLPQMAVVDGDATCASIAAASIIAKVARDAVMCGWDRWYPQYGFASHKGYATPDHLRRIETHGLSPLHRSSWAAVARRAMAHASTASLEAPDG
jgi:ribonuclease HII